METQKIGARQRENRSGSRGRWRWLIVVVAVVGALGVLRLAVFVTGGYANNDDEEVVEQPAVTPTSESTPDFVTGPAPAVTATTDAAATPQWRIERVDTSRLPELAATHLAVGSRGSIEFLDFQSGVWSRVELSSELDQLVPVAEGVVFNGLSGSIAYVGVGGADPVVLLDASDGWLVGVTDDLVVLSLYAEETARERVEARRVNGTLEWSLELPATSSARAVSGDGRVVFAAGEQIALADPTTGEYESVATGSLVRVWGELLLIHSCTEALDCGIDQLDPVTGERSHLIDDNGSFGEVTGDSVVFFSNTSDTWTRFELVDGLLTAVDTGAQTGPVVDRSYRVIDISGATIDLLRDQIRFLDSDGEVVAVLPEPFDGIRGDDQLALINIATQ